MGWTRLRCWQLGKVIMNDNNIPGVVVEVLSEVGLHNEYAIVNYMHVLYNS